MIIFKSDKYDKTDSKIVAQIGANYLWATQYGDHVTFWWSDADGEEIENLHVPFKSI